MRPMILNTGILRLCDTPPRRDIVLAFDPSSQGWEPMPKILSHVYDSSPPHMRAILLSHTTRSCPSLVWVPPFPESFGCHEHGEQATRFPLWHVNHLKPLVLNGLRQTNN